MNSNDLDADFYILSTPIGNCKDITIRALETLGKIDAIICEDTRVTSRLLEFHNIKKPMYQYNDFSNAKTRAEIIKKLSSGLKLALVSDAGTPMIADPGYKLVREIYKAGFKIDANPGVCAAIAALTLSMLPTDIFCFLGFLPTTIIKRRKFLEKWNKIKASLIIYESPKRLIAALEDINYVFGNCNISVVRELTKIFQENISGEITNIISIFKKRERIKGEYVIIISPNINSDENIDAKILAFYENNKGIFTLKDIVQKITEEFDIKRKYVYGKILEYSQK